MTFLLDINALIALLDPAHVQHDAAHEWFAARGRQSWASCPLTENGVLRIVGHPRYPNSPGTPAALACAHQGQLATFDRRLVADAVHGGAQGLHLIG